MADRIGFIGEHALALGGSSGNVVVRRRWVVCSAWPYVHYVPHLGNLVGSALSADVFARYLRLRGDDVIFVSGSDEHGTPIEVEAIKIGVEPKELTDRMHEVVVKLFKLWNISFDNYTRTESETHKRFVRWLLLRIHERGFTFVREERLPFCPRDKIFLPDRFVVGTCPYCKYDKARGDQCENCGSLMDPEKLIDPRCAVCNGVPEWRSTKHVYLDLSRLERAIREYLETNSRLPENVKWMSLSIVSQGLRPRSVTRDNRWGISSPFPGLEDKTVYVWFEALLGYISATIEYFERLGNPDGWREYWMDERTRVVFFIGKDNIPFHAIMLPAMLIASGEKFVLPYTISATEYLLYEGRKFSKSQRVGIWIDEALHILPVDYWRFILIYIRPEARDTNLTWDQVLEITNSIINDTIGNFVHRVLVLVKRGLNGITPGVEVETDTDYLERSVKLFSEVTSLYESIRLKDALHATIEIARLGNKYLNERRPWDYLRTDLRLAKSMIARALHMVKMLAIALYPVMPESMSRLWHMMGYETDVSKASWFDALRPVPEGLRVGDVRPLFRKITREELERRINYVFEMRAKRWESRYPWDHVMLPESSSKI